MSETVKEKIIPATLLALLFLAAFWVLGRGDKGISENTGLKMETEEFEQEESSRFEQPENILGELASSPNALKGELDAVDGSSSSGTGYLLFRDNMTLHAVIAELPDPADGSVYEGWLVQPSPLKFFSTGVMEDVGNGSWVLEYARAGDYPSYTRVVITEEKELDGEPETHIIEGNVK